MEVFIHVLHDTNETEIIKKLTKLMMGNIKKRNKS
jgi:hypothetical protein